jgi:hypothetical protein
MLLFLTGMNVVMHTINQEGNYFYCKTRQEKEIYHNFVNSMLELLKKHGALLESTSGKHALKYVASAREAEWVLAQDPEILNKDPGPGKYSYIYQAIYAIGGTAQGDKIIDLYVKRGAIERRQVDLISFARSKKCQFFVIESLLKRFPKYSVNTLTIDGKTMLTQYGKDGKTIDKLVAMGGKIHSRDLTSVLWTAVKKGSVAAINKILDSGADPGEFSYTRVCVLIPICHEFTKKRCRLQPYLQLLSKVLDYPSIKASPMSQSLETAFAYIFEDIFNCLIWPNIKDRLKDVLTCIFNSNENIKSIIFKQSDKQMYYNVAGYTLNYQSYDLMGYAIQTYTRRSDVSLQLSVEKFFNILFDIGISVSNTQTGCITALTSALIATKEDDIRTYLPDEQPPWYSRSHTRTSANKEEIDRIICIVIQHGVKTNIQALQIENVESKLLGKQQQDMMLDLIKRTHLPDALLLALLRNKLKLTKKLISDWWGPPLALMIFNPNWNQAYFIPWFEMLQSYGGIPHGTPMYELAKHLLDQLEENTRLNLTNQRRDVKLTVKAFEQQLGEFFFFFYIGTCNLMFYI